MKLNEYMAVLAFIPAVSVADPSNLSYSLIETGAGLGRLSLKTVGRSYDFKSQVFSGGLSYQLDENYL